MKRISKVMCALALCAAISGCGNYDLIDTKWHFDEAIVRLPNGEIVQGPIESWSDGSGSENGGDGWIQVKINGITYYASLVNVTLIDK